MTYRSLAYRKMKVMILNACKLNGSYFSKDGAMTKRQRQRQRHVGKRSFRHIARTRCRLVIVGESIDSVTTRTCKLRSAYRGKSTSEGSHKQKAMRAH